MNAAHTWRLFALLAACVGAQFVAAQTARSSDADNDAEGLSGPRLVDTLRNLQLQLSPLGEADVASALPLELGGRSWLNTAVNTSNTQAASGPAPTWGPASQECSALRQRVVGLINNALQSSGWVVQPGLMDWGFLGSQNETQACGGTNCAYTNPTSPYGLSVLPPAPASRRGGSSTATSDADDASLPAFVKQDMKQRAGANPSPPPGRSQRPLTSLAQATADALGPSSSSSSTSSSSHQDQLPTGSSAAYQLLPDEVVVLAGCVPPASASRYFGITGYLHSAWDDVQRNAWVSVFAAVGDTLGGYTEPHANGSLSTVGTRNRLNTSLPSTVQAGTRSKARRLNQAAAAQQPASSAASSAKKGGEISPWDGVSATLGALPTDLLTSGDQEAEGSSPGATTSSSDPFGQFSIVIMTASKEAAAKVQAALQQVLQQAGLLGTTDTSGSSSNTNSSASSTSVSGGQRLAVSGSGSTPINVLPIPAPFNAGMGLGGHAPWFMLLLRNIVPAGKLDGFVDYTSRSPWSVWRLTPLDSLPPSPGTSPVGLLPLLPSRRAAASPPPAPTAIIPPQDPADTWPTPQVVPRLPRPTATGANQSESWLGPAFEALNAAVGARLARLGYTLNWNLGSESPFVTAGMDWGIDCYQRKIDFCNGDNRDAQYISSLPLVQLNSLRKVLYVTGVNHVATGLAAYTNIAPSDPVQRLGLESWDDAEVRGSADSYLAGGPYASLSPYLYTVAFSRNCTGLAFCKEIPLTGARSVPLLRALFLIERAYVNPATGVGPSSARLINFRAVVATPSSEARPWDSKPYRPAPAVSSCASIILNTTLACSPPTSSLPGASSSTSLAQSLAAAAGSLQMPSEDSPCCLASKAWADSKCWCSDDVKQMLDDIAPVVGRVVMGGVGRLCGTRTDPAACLA